MKTSNLLAAMISVVLSTSGFLAIDYLFTHASNFQEQRSDELMLHARTDGALHRLHPTG